MPRNMDLEGMTVLCAASSYEQKFYLNEKFAGLPEAIRQELQILCVMYTEEVGGVLTLEIPKAANEPSCFYQIVVE